MNFQISRTPTWAWLLSVFGATKANSVVTVEQDTLDVHFGFFHHRLPLTNLKSAGVVARKLPWYRYSLGWRTDFQGRIALMGEAANVVELQFSTPFEARVAPLTPMIRCHTLLISMEAPDAFVAELGRRLATHSN